MPSRSVVAAAVLGAAAGLGALLAPEAPSDRPVPATMTDGATLPAEDSSLVTVQVSGWVLEPGVIEVPAGSLVAEAIAAAGGAAVGARLDLVNLASPIVDGTRIEVPGPGGDGAVASAAGDGLVSLNSAGLDELESLPGVGPVLAERIIAHRDANGPFTLVEDLLEVAGIGEAKLAAIRDLVSVP